MQNTIKDLSAKFSENEMSSMSYAQGIRMGKPGTPENKKS